MNRSSATDVTSNFPYSCVFTSCAVYHTPFPILRLTNDEYYEKSIVTAVMGSGQYSDPTNLFNLDFSYGKKSSFSQLLNHDQQVSLPSSQLCLDLTTDFSNSLYCVVLSEKNDNPIIPNSSAFIYGFGDTGPPKNNSILRSCYSCDLNRNGLWCLTQPGNDLQSGILHLSFNELVGVLQLDLGNHFDIHGIVNDPISIKTLDDNNACIFTAHDIFISDFRAQGINRIFYSKNQLISGTLCQNGDRVLLSSEEDTLMVLDMRKTTHILYEAVAQSPIILRSFRQGNIALTISHRQVGILHVGKLEFLGSFDSSSGVLDAITLKEEQNSIRILSTSADGCLSDFLMEF